MHNFPETDCFDPARAAVLLCIASHSIIHLDHLGPGFLPFAHFCFGLTYAKHQWRLTLPQGQYGTQLERMQGTARPHKAPRCSQKSLEHKGDAKRVQGLLRHLNSTESPVSLGRQSRGRRVKRVRMNFERYIELHLELHWEIHWEIHWITWSNLSVRI